MDYESKIVKNRLGKDGLSPSSSEVIFVQDNYLQMSNRTGYKFGGRTKGTPNKITSERRKELDLFLENNFEEFENRMKAIENPADYCRLYIQLLNYVLPKISSVTIKDEPHRETLAEELDRIAFGE